MNSAKRGSLQKIFEGFCRISNEEKTAYLKYLSLVIEKKTNAGEKRRLIRFKAKLERESFTKSGTDAANIF
jgi:hypothetical protein